MNVLIIMKFLLVSEKDINITKIQLSIIANKLAIF